jgi:hypothetical protein
VVVSISKKGEELGLYIVVQNSTFSNRCLKVVSANASLGSGGTVRFWGDDRCVLNEGVKTLLMALMSPLLTLQLPFCRDVYSRCDYAVTSGYFLWFVVF